MVDLFWTFFRVGMFSFGGGYAAMPLIQESLVNHHQWLTLQQFSDIITLSQMTPGPLSVNAATFVGMSRFGLVGSVVATYALVIPSIILCFILSYFYYKYRDLSSVSRVLKVLRGAVIGLIFVGGVQLAQSALFVDIKLIKFIIFIIVVILIIRFKIDSIFSILISGILGFIVFYLLKM